MTRKRTSESLERQLLEPCPYCEGRGRIRSTETESFDLLREIRRHSIQTGHKTLKIRVRDDIRNYIENEEADLLKSLIEEFDLEIQFTPATINLSALNDDSYEVFSNS